MKIAVDAMSGDLGSKPVVEAIKNFKKDYPEIELHVVGK